MPLTILGNIGPTTGNVHHDGNVRVSGSIAPDHVLEATGDVLILGSVRDAEIISGGRVTVKGILTGADALIDALGTVRVRQAVDARIISGGDVVIASSAERCRLASAGHVRLPHPPGLIRGGTAKAGLGVELFRAEAASGEPAAIAVGPEPFDDGREQVVLRLEFARSQWLLTEAESADSPVEFRRRVATARAYEHLVFALDRRLRQIRRVDTAKQDTWFRVLGDGPLEARVTLSGRPVVLPATAAAFEALHQDGKILVRPLKEAICVG